MIFGNRISLTCHLVAKSDIHVGAGDTAIGKDGREFSQLVRQGDMPILPASSLKGVLRAALAERGDPNLASIFGNASNVDERTGQAAHLWLDHAVLMKPAEDLNGLSEHPAEGGVYRAKHVALDPATGAAAENKLFDKEQIAKGAIFRFSAEWFGEDELTVLAPLFAALRDGVQVGAGDSKGQGQIELVPNTLKATAHRAEGGKLVPTAYDTKSLVNAIDRQSFETSGRTITLTLTAEGPYLSVRKTGREGQGNEMQPLERDGKPVLWTTSLAGALRARARWLAGLKSADDTLVDDRDRKRSAEELKQLNELERLFGVAGRKAQLRVASITCKNAGSTITLTSNSRSWRCAFPETSLLETGVYRCVGTRWRHRRRSAFAGKAA
ncbi:MAG: RAMP superfamily CRISPR-associated protein [Maritimibacter sp.]